MRNIFSLIFLILIFFLFRLPIARSADVHEYEEEALKQKLRAIVEEKGPFRNHEPGERPILFEQRLNSAIQEAQDGNPASLHDVLDELASYISSKEECLSIMEDLGKIYFRGDNRTKALEALQSRKPSTKELIQKAIKGESAAKKEYWRRVEALVAAGEGVWNKRQVNQLVAYYFRDLTPKEKEKATTLTAVLLSDFLTAGVQKESRNKFAANIAQRNPFPCDEKLVSELRETNEAIDERSPKIQYPSTPLKVAVRAYTAHEGQGPYKALTDGNHVIEADTPSFYQREKKAREDFFSWFAGTEKKPLFRPTLGEYLDRLKAQAADPRLSKDNQSGARSELEMALDYLAYNDAQGQRSLKVNGQVIPLEPSRTLEDPPRKSDLPRVSGIKFESAQLGIPTYEETAGKPPSAAQIQRHFQIHQRNAQNITDEEELKAYWKDINQYWQERKEAYQERWGGPAPEGMFPAPVVVRSKENQELLDEVVRLRTEQAEMRRLLQELRQQRPQ